MKPTKAAERFKTRGELERHLVAVHRSLIVYSMPQKQLDESHDNIHEDEDRSGNS